jgi:hypothetical protein
MITEYTKKDVSNVLSVINNAALKYKGVIPDDCWHEPYMSEQELSMNLIVVFVCLGMKQIIY